MVSKTKVAIIENPAPEGVEGDDTANVAPDLKKKELIEAIVARSDLKKGVTRQTLDVAFAIMAEALEEGRGLNVPPFGKLTINRERTNGSGEKVLITKFRISSPKDDEDATDAGAEAESEPAAEAPSKTAKAKTTK